MVCEPGGTRRRVSSRRGAKSELASETRAGTILQLCLYSEIVAEIQGAMPEHLWVVSPGRLAEPEKLRTSDFLAYHRRIKRHLLAAVEGR